jgi:glucokinase
MFIGIDIGGTKVQIAVYKNNNIRILNKVPTPRSYEELMTFISKKVKMIEKEEETIRAIAIGIPGQVYASKTVWVPNLPFLNNQDFAEDLSKQLNVPIFIANDAQLALLGESWVGIGKNKSNILLISVGTGIGGAIMAGGKIIRGHHGTAGALGWMNLDVNASPDHNHGHLERTGSGTALNFYGKTLYPPLSSYEIIEKARLKDSQCVSIVEKVGSFLGKALASLTSVLDPEIIIFSGGLCSAFDVFEPIIKKHINEHASPSTKETPIVVSTLGNLAGVYGALKLAREEDAIWL